MIVKTGCGTDGSFYSTIQDPALLSHKVFVCTDQVRRTRHMTLGRAEWAWHMLSFPRHLLVTCFVEASEKLGIFHPHHPAYRSV